MPEAPGSPHPEPCATCATPTLIYGPEPAEGEAQRLLCANPEHPDGPNKAAPEA